MSIFGLSWIWFGGGLEQALFPGQMRGLVKKACPSEELAVQLVT